MASAHCAGGSVGQKGQNIIGPDGVDAMRFFDRFKRKPTDPAEVPASGPSAGDDGTTTADRPDFTLSVPFRWEAVPNAEGYEFRNRVLPEQIVVTVLHHQRELGTEELADVITRVAGLRRKAIRELSSGQARLAEAPLRRGDGYVEARAIGEDTQNMVRLAFVVRGTAKKTVTVALTRYTLDEVGAPFEHYAGVIFDLLKIKTGG
jgi:hypothetical protein